MFYVSQSELHYIHRFGFIYKIYKKYSVLQKLSDVPTTYMCSNKFAKIYY